jgi:hypothetical protein
MILCEQLSIFRMISTERLRPVLGLMALNCGSCFNDLSRTEVSRMEEEEDEARHARPA